MAGKVILIGAGPGDPGLMTLKGLRELRRADVVVYDRLVDGEIMAMIPETARRIDVGKRVANHPVPQDEINRILLREAQAGRRVVRLKGGDCFLFGRGGEELELLAENGVDFEVVPGITSALAAPAYGGIPATHRDFCASVHIITGHRRKNEELRLDYEALVRLNGTLVFLMSVATFGEIAQGLMGAGMAADFPCAIVENGTRPEQRRILTTVSGAGACILENDVQSPAIFVVGRVCALADRMDWYDRLPLKGARVLVARPRSDSHRLAELLRERGARVWELPAPEPEFMEFDWPEPGSTLILPDGESVAALFDALACTGRDARALWGFRLVAGSRDAAKALEGRGIQPDAVEFDRQEPAVVLAREDACGEWRERMPHARVLPAWRRRLPEPLDAIPEADFVTLTTLSSVEAFRAALAGRSVSGLRAVCIGPRTQQAAQALGLTAVQAQDATLESVADCLEELLEASEKS